MRTANCVPEEHASLWSRPFRKPPKVTAHGSFKHVALASVELRHHRRMRLEAVVSPRGEQGVRDRLGERRRL